jgi:hypothetical protein
LYTASPIFYSVRLMTKKRTEISGLNHTLRGKTYSFFSLAVA